MNGSSMIVLLGVLVIAIVANNHVVAEQKNPFEKALESHFNSTDTNQDGKITFEEYVGDFDSVAPRNYAVASFLTGCGKYTLQNKCAATRTTSNDKLYVFADHPSIYFLSGLDPASRFITYYHILIEFINQRI